MVATKTVVPTRINVYAKAKCTQKIQPVFTTGSTSPAEPGG
jgi:hypothetical protein